MTQKSFRFSVRIDGPGIHPGAWARQSDALAQISYDPLAAARHVVEVAERHGIAFCVFDDSYVSRTPTEVDNVRYDGLSLAAALAPITTHIGLVPAVNALLTEPFHVSRSVATLDFITQGRGGWQPLVSELTHAELRYAGERQFAQVNENRHGRAEEFLEATRQLWYSWEEDAIIWDVEAGRFLDADKVKRINFSGEFFSVAGPSPTPRPPQGIPFTVIEVDDSVSLALAAKYADVAVLKAREPGALAESASRLREHARAAGNAKLEVFAAVAVYVADSPEAAGLQRALLEKDGGVLERPLLQLTGSPVQVAQEIMAILSAAALDGIELALVDSDATILQWAQLLLPALHKLGIQVEQGYPGIADHLPRHEEEKSQ